MKVLQNTAAYDSDDRDDNWAYLKCHFMEQAIAFLPFFLFIYFLQAFLFQFAEGTKHTGNEGVKAAAAAAEKLTATAFVFQTDVQSRAEWQSSRHQEPQRVSPGAKQCLSVG